MTNRFFYFHSKRLITTTSLLITTLFILTTSYSRAGASLQTATDQNTPAASNFSDWPRARYDTQRSSHNSLENILQPPFDEVPTSLTFDPDTIHLPDPFSVIANDQLFWGTKFRSQNSPAYLAASDLDENELWKLSIPADNLTTAPHDPNIVGDTLFVTEYEAKADFSDEGYFLVARNRSTGAEKWRHPVLTFSPNSNQEDGAMLIDEEGDFVYVSWKDDQGRYISKLNVETGATLWQFEIDPFLGSADFMAAAKANTGLNSFFVVHANVIVAYNIQNGAEIWRYNFGQEFSVFYDAHDLVVHDTLAYVANENGIRAIDLATGAKSWGEDFESDCEADDDMGMATDGSRLFVSGVCTTRLVAYDLNTGVELWNKEILRGVGFNRSLAVANGFVYAEGYSDTEGAIIYAFDINGNLIQDIVLLDAIPSNLTAETGLFLFVKSLSIANGQLYVAWSKVNGTGVMSVWGEGTGAGRLYLDEFDDDNHPATNPTEDAVVPLVKRDGTYGVEISIAAKIGTQPARLVIYDNNGAVYKEATGEPNPFGYGYFLAPLEYTAAGYEYQVILDNGDELPKRKVLFAANPETDLEAIVDTSGMTWQAPPNTITTVPATLTANLPGGFPAGATEATFYLQEAGRGAVTLNGVRSGNQVQFTIDKNNGINGDFVVTAIAQADNHTVYSSDLNLTIDSTSLPDVRVQATTSIIPQLDGTYNSYSYNFERERQTLNTTTTADVQIASVVPDPAGYQVTLLVRTPPAVPLDALTQKWDVSLRGVDQGGNVTSIVSEEINAEPGGTYVVLGLPHSATGQIARIEAFGSTTEGATRTGQPSLLRTPLIPAAGGCNPTSSPPPNSPANNKPLKLTDVVNVNIDSGVSAELVYGGGVSTAVYGQREVFSNQAQVCVEGGVRAGGGIGGGPLAGIGLAINLRGANHDAPASSGTKYDITGKLIAGVQLSYSAPDNWGKGGYGTLGLGVGLAPSASVSGGVTQYQCKPFPKKEIECCKGNSCGPQPPNPPGGDHPDDTQSVVINHLNVTTTDDGADYWGQVLRFASKAGLIELRDYAIFRLASNNRLSQIASYPVGTPLSDDQRATLARQEAERIEQAAKLAANWSTILAQLDLLEATQANVLANGYYQQMSDLLTGYGIPNQFVTPDFSPDALKDSLLVIPTAGLYGLSDNPTFAARLERFVEQGGTLLVMAQPEDDGFDLLPGNWNAVGYQNDQSCWVAAMTPVAQHPMLSSIDQPTVKANVDGYMTSWPNTAELLLKRTKNDQGSFVLDRVGDGHMIVTNMYDDWGRTVGQSSPQVRNLFRDVARWALTADDNLPTTDLNKTVSIPLTLTNLTDQSAKQVRYTVRGANGQIQNGGPGTVALSLAVEKATEQTISVTPTAADYGLWSISYTLLDSVGNDLSGETFGGYFAVNGQTVRAADFGQTLHTAQAPQTPVAATVTAEVTFDKAAYTANDTVEASLAINVSGASGGQLRISSSLGGDTQEKIVAASSQTVNFSFPADFSGNGLFYFGIFDDATDQGLYLDTSWIQPAGTAATITPNKVRYAPGETVTLNISGSYSGTVAVDGADFSNLLTVNSGTPSAQTTLPANMASGSYSAQYSDNGQLLTAHFDVAGPQVTVSKMGINNAVADADETVSITADVSTNQALDVIIVGQMVDASGNEVGVYSESKTLVNGNQTVVMPVEVLTSAAGTVRYEISILDAADSSVIHTTAHRFISLDLPQVLGLNTDGGTVSADQTTLMVDFYSPSAQTVMLVVEVDGVSVFSKSVSIPAGFSSQSIPLPSSLEKGGHSAFMQATVGSLSSEKTASFVVGDALPQPNGAIYLPLIGR